MLSSPSNEATSLATICINKLSSFLSDADQNLRYIALKGLSRLLSTHAHLLSIHYEEILACIEEEDLTIRMKALELVERLTNRSNCKEIVKRLMTQISPSSTQSTVATDSSRPSASAALRAIFSNYDTTSPSGLANGESISSTALSSPSSAIFAYKHRLLALILRLTSRASEDGSQLYVNISNFEWYIDTLISVSHLSLSLPPSHTSSSSLVVSSEVAAVATKVAEGLLDVTARAASMREYTIVRLKGLLFDDGFVDRAGVAGASILAAAAFVLSEYGSPQDGKETCVMLITRASQAPIASGSILLCASKALAKWLNSFVTETWHEDNMSLISQELNSIIEFLKRAGHDGDSYIHLISSIVAGLNGPRLSIQSPTRARTESSSTKEEEEADDPAHNPFATSSAAASASHQPKMISDDKGAPTSLAVMQSVLLAYEIRPLAHKAQAAVTVPAGLDLDAWVGQPFNTSRMSDSDEAGGRHAHIQSETDEYGRPKAIPQRSRAYLQDREVGLANVKKKKGKRKGSKRGAAQEEEDIDAIPIMKLDLDAAELLSPQSFSSKLATPSATETAPPEPRVPSPPLIILSAGGDMPSSRASKVADHTVNAALEPSVINSPHSLVTELNGNIGEVAVSQKIPVRVIKAKKKKKARDTGLGGEKEERRTEIKAEERTMEV